MKRTRDEKERHFARTSEIQGSQRFLCPILIPSKYFPSLAFIKSCGDHYPGFIVPTDFVCLEVPA
jgi:hypothetical protein